MDRKVRLMRDNQNESTCWYSSWLVGWLCVGKPGSGSQPSSPNCSRPKLGFLNSQKVDKIGLVVYISKYI